MTEKPMAGLANSKVTEFYQNVKTYFKTVCEYLLKKLPLSDPVMSKLVIADPLKHQKAV